MSSVDKIAVVYARYSSHGQTEQSIEGQIAAAQKYAEQHGYTIIHVYADRAMTGRNDDREQFQKMLSDTAMHQFGVILLWKIDRFGRNREEIAFNRYRCKKNGVRVERVAEDVPDGPEGVILDSVLEGMAEYYSLQLAQNVRRGQRESAKKSMSIGGNKMLGYIVNPETKRYESDPKTASYVTEIFKRYANGETISEIVAWLNAQGIRTTRGSEFTVNSLHRLLKNEKYTGVYIFHDIRNEGGMPALTDRTTFDKVQEMLKVNRRAPARVWSKTEYLLTDKLFCGHCGAMMVGESGHGRNGIKHSYYTCLNRKKKKSCDKKPVRQDVIESLVLRAIGKLLENPATLENIADQVWAAYERSDTSGDAIKALDKQIADVDRALSNVMKAIEMGIINEMTKTRMDELTNQKQALSTARAEAGLAEGFKLTRDMILFFLQEISALDMADRDSQKRLIKTFVNAIYLYDDHFDIAFNYTDNGNVVVRMREINDAARGEMFGRCAQCPTRQFVLEPNSLRKRVRVRFFIYRVPHTRQGRGKYAMNLKKVHHIAIIGSNYEKSRRFYVDLLGFSVIRENYRPERDDYKIDLQLDGMELELFIIKNCPKRPSYPEAYGLRHLAFAVDSVDDTVRELNKKGILTEPIRVDAYTGKKMTFFSDPDNLPLEIHE